MGKLTTILVMISGISLLFYLFGLMGENSLIALILNPQNIQTSGFWSSLTGILTGGGLVAGIIIGFVTQNFELAAMAPFATLMIAFLFDFIQVYQVLAVESIIMANIIFSPLILIMLISIVDWWRGRD